MSSSAGEVRFPRYSTPEGLPDPLLQELTRDGAVAHVIGPAGTGAWLVGSDEEARVVLSDTERFTSEPDLSLDERGKSAASMAVTDPPEHTRLRKLASKVFASRRINEMAPDIQRLVASLLDDMEKSGPPADLVQSLALPLPMSVICQMLDVPTEHGPDLVRWSNYLTSLTEFTAAEIREGLGELHGYMARLVAQRRQNLGDDLLSDLIRARDDRDALSEQELIAMASMLVTGGHKAPVRAITRGVLALLNSGYWARFVAGEIPTEKIVEEALRHQSPIDTAAWRTATVDTELGGVAIKAGDAVFVSLHLANHDPVARTDPHAFDPEREDDGHLSFGHGIHYCLGSGLARVQLTAAFGGLADRFPGLRLHVPLEDLEWTTGHLMNGPATLPLSW